MSDNSQEHLSVQEINESIAVLEKQKLQMEKTEQQSAIKQIKSIAKVAGLKVTITKKPSKKQ